MGWKITGPGGRWVEYSGGKVTGDIDSEAAMVDGAGLPVPVTPTGPCYRPNSADDEAGLFLLATNIVPGPQKITGSRPPIPDVPYAVPEGDGIAY